MSFIATGAFVGTYGAAIAATVAVAGTAVAYNAQQQQAKAAEATSKYNARIQQDQNTRENTVAAENIRRQTRDNNRQLAQIRAANAARGLAMEGTPLAVLGEASMMLERDIQDASYNATARFRSQAQGAQLTLWEGKQQSSALKTQSYATALQGASSASSGYRTAKGLDAPSSGYLSSNGN